MTKTNEILKVSITNVKEAAYVLKKSPAMIYKWQEGTTPNPIDKALELIDYVDDTDDQLINFMCNQRGGFFGKIDEKEFRQKITINEIHRKISNLIRSISDANEDEYFTETEINRMECDYFDFCAVLSGFITKLRKQKSENH